ncbi:MAG: hypothetical protein EOO77_24840 [Oxalobacteraceae bacterium]|nr:MAG: hypothetical protein EOO77_24840 [Oxalobacteraceae bacterium]
MAILDELSFLQYLKDEGGYTHLRPLGDGRWVGLMRFAFTWAICTGRMGDRHTYEDRWCYHDRSVAIAALEAWDGQGEPEGWHRHPLTGRRCENGIQVGVW